jgi:hypothetical protein
MQFVPIEDLSTARDLGIEVILANFHHDGTPTDWLTYLDAAHALDLQVIPWLWPEGWSWDGATWRIDEQATLYLQTVAGHPALLAIYLLHEPYWRGCTGCGYTTAEQQALYRAVKSIADVPTYSEIGGIAYWTAYSPETVFADGVCDYCSTWHYPFKDGGIYERDQVRAILEADLATAKRRAPNSKIVWTMQAIEYRPDHLRMPTADEMRDLAALVYARKPSGAWWYLWTFEGHYDDVLANHRELHPVVRDIYRDIVLPVKPPPATATPGPTLTTTATHIPTLPTGTPAVHCHYLPLVHRSLFKEG